MDRPESVIHLTALEPLRLKLVIGLHPLDRFTKLVKIADGLAISIACVFRGSRSVIPI